MSDWSFWSGCKKNCQASERVRVRHVEQPPSNSGKPCPGLEQKAGCREYRDRHGNHCGLNTGIQPQTQTDRVSFVLFVKPEVIK